MQRLRALGACLIELPGIRVEFPSASSPFAAEVPAEQPDEKAVAREAKRQFLDTLYAATGGWTGTDEELDRLTGFGSV